MAEPTVQTNRRFGTLEATIAGEGGDALTVEVLRALSEMKGEEVLVLIKRVPIRRAKKETGEPPPKVWTAAS